MVSVSQGIFHVGCGDHQVCNVKDLVYASKSSVPVSESGALHVLILNRPPQCSGRLRYVEMVRLKATSTHRLVATPPEVFSDPALHRCSY